MSPRSLRNWKRADPAERGPGRPALSAEQLEEAREAVLGELERQGWSAGEEPIWRGLGCRLPRSRVRRVLAELKAERRARHRAHLRASRVSVRVEARDVLWSLDATHLGRDERGAAVQAEVLREVASTTTIALSVGPAAKGHEIVGLLERAVEDRGGAPLVLLTDNGAAYCSEVVTDWCAARGVLQLFSLPRTPQHNAASEHGMGEIKAETALGKGVVVDDIAAAAAELVEALERLDGARLRRTRGWRTARQDDAQRAHWSALVSREEVLERASCRIAAALLHSNSGRARRRAIREAILGALEECSVITRTRGGRCETAQCAEVFS